MTEPVTCACGTARLDGCPGPLDICLVPGYVFEETVQRTDSSGNPVDWPAGTETRLRFTWGTGTELIVPGTVSGSELEFAMTPAETEQTPRRATATIDVNYDGGDPDLWRPWRQGRVDCR